MTEQQNQPEDQELLPFSTMTPDLLNLLFSEKVDGLTPAAAASGEKLRKIFTHAGMHVAPLTQDADGTLHLVATFNDLAKKREIDFRIQTFRMYTEETKMHSTGLTVQMSAHEYKRFATNMTVLKNIPDESNPVNVMLQSDAYDQTEAVGKALVRGMPNRRIS